MKKMNPVVHFEMPAEDRKRMADFYTSVFGWKVQMLGEEMGNYSLVTTSDLDENGRPKDAGMINGGFFPKEPGRAEHTSLVIAVDDIREAMRDIEKAGGKLLGEPSEIPGYGLYVSFIDTENNQVSLMQPSDDWQK